MIIVHELGHFWSAKKFNAYVEEFGFGLPPRIFGKKKGETIYSVNLLPIGGFVKIRGENREDEKDDLPKERYFYNLDIWKRAVVLTAGVAMNFVFGWFLLTIVFLSGTPDALFIAEVAEDSPAFEAGIMTNDRVVDFNTAEEFIAFVNLNKGQEISLNIEREGENLVINVMPRLAPPENQGALGVALVEGGADRQGFFTSIWESLKVSAEIFSMIFVGLFKLIKLAILGQEPLAGVGGPIAIVKLTSQVSSLGFIYLLQFMALISINLAAINIFPFPALDGGRLLFLMIEKIKGSPLPKRFENYANAVGMGLLLLLMVLLTVKDIGRFF